MKKVIVSLTIFAAVLASACSNSQSTKTSLEAKEFQTKVTSTKNAIVLDVRTADEYNNGHLTNAVNIDWNESAAEAKLKALDPTSTYFVYCLSGGRSSGAAEYLRENGFKEVYELDGGIMKWRAASLPEENTSKTVASKADELSLDAYNSLLKSNKTVVIDFYAEWCAPCKKMAPYLTELQQTMKDKIEIVRIDADKNPVLCKTLQIDALPTIFVYKGGSKTFEHVGFISKENLVKML